MHRERIARLQQALKSERLACALIVPGPNLFYLTGLRMRMSERITMFVVPAAGEPVFIAPRLEAEKIREYTGVKDVFDYVDEAGPITAAERALAGLHVRGGRVGAEYRYMRLLERDLIERAAAPLGFRDIGAHIAEMRMVKDAEELAAMQRAAAIVDIGAAAAKAAIAPGVTEREVAAAVERAMLAAGAEAVPFNTILTGPNGALPHGLTGDRPIREGDLVICDIGAEYKGYVADITRTYPCGKPEPKLVEIYRVVYEAQKNCREKVRAGMSGAQIDALARTVIARAGYGEYFIHRTGHGLGLEVHEEPYIVQTNTRPLSAGMTFTIEPGVYLPGIGGVRIEDDVVLTPDGCRVLTQSPRELEE